MLIDTDKKEPVKKYRFFVNKNKKSTTNDDDENDENYIAVQKRVKDMVESCNDQLLNKDDANVSYNITNRQVRQPYIRMAIGNIIPLLAAVG